MTAHQCAERRYLVRGERLLLAGLQGDFREVRQVIDAETAGCHHCWRAIAMELYGYAVHQIYKDGESAEKIEELFRTIHEQLDNIENDPSPPGLR